MRPLGILFSATIAIRSYYFVVAHILSQCGFPQLFFFKDRQVVALTVTGDKPMFIRCGVSGHQDTLFANAGRYYFYNSTSKGSVDFIFGSVKYIYKHCVLHPLSRFGAITT